MSPLRISLTVALSSLLATGCAVTADDGEGEPSIEDLEDGLTPLGKADAGNSGISVYAGGIGMRGAAGRTLYNLLDSDADSRELTGNGYRILFARGIGCITNGLDTYCEAGGRSNFGNQSYEAIIHGRRGRSAAGTLYTLLDGGNGDAFVETPWFACERTSGSAVWCGVETSERLTLSFEGLEDSGDDFVYEGWAVSGGVATTTDCFRAGPTVDQRVPRSIADDSLYVLTIEPRRGDDPAPAKTHLVAGELELGATSDITTAHPAALGTDFAAAAGGFILATPTSPDATDDNQGVWFVDPMAGAPSLSLPALTDGWVYEGWVVAGDGPVSTGRFTDVMGADSDGAGPTAGPNAGPPFPGQDFINPAVDSIGATIVISVEPEPDNLVTPFAIKPLIAAAASADTAPIVQPIGNTSENRPSAVATFGH